MLYSINKYPFLSYENIKTFISDYDIYNYYLNSHYELGKAYKSPLRNDDNNPSFGLFESTDGKILFKDQGKAISGNSVYFVQLYLGLPNYESAICRIIADLIIGLKSEPESEIIVESNNIVIKNKVQLGVQRQDFSEKDINYWKQFNISKEILELFEVSSIKYLFRNNIIRHTYSDDNPMYVFKVYDALKIYRPLSNKNEKWYGSTKRTHIFGYKQLPETGALLIITKSLKDVMCLHSLGYTAISPASEGTLIPKEVINNLKTRFKKILVFYDNDEPGKKYTERMNKKYNLEYIFIPEDSNEKDISDYVKTYGKGHANALLEFLLTNK